MQHMITLSSPGYVIFLVVIQCDGFSYTVVCFEENARTSPEICLI